jgi:hypothetical protein
MELRLEREPSAEGCTIGRLYVDGMFECWTLEDVVRPVKIPGQTAIPHGHYVVTLTKSKRFQRVLPLVNAVPGFEGIRIHAGNTAADTEGCILVGRERYSSTFIGSSRAALEKLLPQLIAQHTITLDVIDG